MNRQWPQATVRFFIQPMRRLLRRFLPVNHFERSQWAVHIWEVKHWEHDRLTWSGFHKFRESQMFTISHVNNDLKQPNIFIEISRQRKTKGPQHCWSFSAQVTVPVTTASTAHSMIILFWKHLWTIPDTTSHTFRTTSPSCMLPSRAARLSGEMSFTKMWLARRRPYSITENTHKNEQ